MAADDGMSVQIAVRLRPFNDREKALNTEKCVFMQGQTTVIKNLKDGTEKSFGFNYCYDSFDRADPNYADQDRVFNDLGTLYLNNAWNGYNCSIFAYGQTGAGKSYSMTGYGADKGIIPRGLEAMFNRMENPSEGTTYRVEVSYLEIYMEKVRDLFNPKQSVPSLKIRESPTLGVYVEDLVKEEVSSYADVDRLMELGNKIRTVAQTNMNATSSRSHSVLTIFFTQTKVDNETMSASDTTSKINLIDLAGSERQDKTGATGDRLKEGSAINQSLTALGNVIEALANEAQARTEFEAKNPGKKFTKTGLVPYRDSKLTRLLQESLGGNAKTIMVAALSPAADNYNETLSTLKYAQRASKIKNSAIVNESPNEKIIRELREELARLRALLTSGGTDPSLVGATGGAPDQAAIDAAREEAKAEVEALKNQLAQQNNYISELQRTKEEKQKEAESRRAAMEEAVSEITGLKVNVDLTKPHLVNLNADALMSESLAFGLEGTTTFGKDKSCSVVIGGVQILPLHATIVANGGVYTLTPSEGAVVFVRGTKVTAPQKLRQSDRIVFGSNHFYRFNDPKEAERVRKEMEEWAAAHPKEASERPPEIFDFEFALRELAANSTASTVATIQARPGETLDEAAERLKLEDLLRRTHPEVAEANAIAAAMARPLTFELKLVRVASSGSFTGAPATVAKVKVIHTDDARESLWDHDKFQDRLYAMKDLYVNYTEYGITTIEEGQSDPFDDPPEDQLIGLSHVLLIGLEDGFAITDLSTAIVDYEGHPMGTLNVEIVPCTPAGEEMDDDVEKGDEWAQPGSRMDLMIKCVGARNLPPKLSSGVFCRFHWFDDQVTYTSGRSEKRTINPDFAHRQQVTVEPVTERFLNFLRDSELIVEVWGHADVAGGGKGERAGTSTPAGGPVASSSSSSTTKRMGATASPAPGAGVGAHKGGEDSDAGEGKKSKKKSGSGGGGDDDEEDSDKDPLVDVRRDPSPPPQSTKKESTKGASSPATSTSAASPDKGSKKTGPKDSGSSAASAASGGGGGGGGGGDKAKDGGGAGKEDNSGGGVGSAAGEAEGGGPAAAAAPGKSKICTIL